MISVDFFAASRPYRPGPRSVWAKREEAGEAVIEVEPGQRYRVTGDVCVHLDGWRLPAKMPAVVVFSEPSALVRFTSKGFVTLTPIQEASTSPAS